MWVMTKHGFFSIVEKPEDKADGMLTIRARVENDLIAIRQFIPSPGEIVASTNTDYPFRVRAHKVDVAYALLKIAMNINYGNFKDQVFRMQGIERSNIYTSIWSTLRELQLPSCAKTSEQPRKMTPQNRLGGLI